MVNSGARAAACTGACPVECDGEYSKAGRPRTRGERPRTTRLYLGSSYTPTPAVVAPTGRLAAAPFRSLISASEADGRRPALPPVQRQPHRRRAWHARTRMGGWSITPVGHFVVASSSLRERAERVALAPPKQFGHHYV